jgi:hypothetical protein
LFEARAPRFQGATTRALALLLSLGLIEPSPRHYGRFALLAPEPRHQLACSTRHIASHAQSHYHSLLR